MITMLFVMKRRPRVNYEPENVIAANLLTLNICIYIYIYIYI